MICRLVFSAFFHGSNAMAVSCFGICGPSSLREERIAEMVAIAWKWYRWLAEQGKDAAQFPSMLATFAARAVNSGRRLCGKENAKDVLSADAQKRHGFKVKNLADYYSPVRHVFEHALTDNSFTPPDEQACFCASRTLVPKAPCH
jgi:hypothetical protein